MSLTSQVQKPLAPQAASEMPQEAAGSCRACPVRRYCALYSPQHTAPPANCPFGPGSVASRKARRPRTS